jgi:hypothetical protein
MLRLIREQWERLLLAHVQDNNVKLLSLCELDDRLRRAGRGAWPLERYEHPAQLARPARVGRDDDDGFLQRRSDGHSRAAQGTTAGRRPTGAQGQGDHVTRHSLLDQPIHHRPFGGPQRDSLRRGGVPRDAVAVDRHMDGLDFRAEDAAQCSR